MRSGTIRWVQQQHNLWNVAITRARSHLIVVGDGELWKDLRGLGAELREAARGALTSEGEPRADGLDLRLFAHLSRQDPAAEVELGAMANGRPADAMIRKSGGDVPVILDPGLRADTDGARHLRLMLRRRDLLSPVGDPGAQRLPAWRLYDA